MRKLKIYTKLTIASWGPKEATVILKPSVILLGAFLTIQQRDVADRKFSDACITVSVYVSHHSHTLHSSRTTLEAKNPFYLSTRVAHFSFPLPTSFPSLLAQFFYFSIDCLNLALNTVRIHTKTKQKKRYDLQKYVKKTENQNISCF